MNAFSKITTSLLGEDEDAFEEQELKARKSSNIILWSIAAFTLLFVIWAALTTVERTVRASGRVVPSSKLQVASNLEGGVVEEIMVNAGDEVRRGQILVRLNPAITGSALGSSEASVGALEARIARLRAEVSGGSPSYGNLPSDQVTIERSLYSARAAELNGLRAAGRARVVQAQRSVAEAQSLLAARESNRATAERELEMIRPLAEQQIVPGIELLQAENAAQIAVAEVAAAQASLARARSSIAEAQASLAQQESDWRSRAGMELSQAQAELSVQQMSLPGLEDRVDRTTIRAPLSGLVNRVFVTTVGGTVGSGEPIVEIVPTNDALYIEAMVSPQDIANVGLSQNAFVEITAYNSAIFGKMAGTVTSISPDAVINEETGESFYTVEVQTTDVLRDQDGNPLDIGPGMVANVSLLGEERSILSYLFTPITWLQENAFRE
ncbi:HlyD family type I secretion periplasmic adaptor subunit [Erythrobacter alti]|uniref:HlyD family type I secretion periplasmic adaptor subunit n=1 Tax=Erythrobacter alti TaxID=1896145 RepID=UPI0030F3F0D2